MPDVIIGDAPVRIGAFSPYKFLEASGVVSDLSQHWPQIASDIESYKANYRAERAATLTRAQAEYSYPEQTGRVSEEAWQHAGNQIAFPGPDPADEEVYVHVFHRVFALARDRVIGLLALCLTPNSELKDADAAGTSVDDATSAMRSRLLHDATLPQLAKAAVAVVAQLREEYAASEEDLGKLGLPRLRPASRPEDPPRATETGKPTPPARGSSNGSRRRSAGTGSRRSTAAPAAGASSSG